MNFFTKFVYSLLFVSLLGSVRLAAASGEGEGGKPSSPPEMPPSARKMSVDSVLRARGKQISRALEGYCGQLKENVQKPESFLAANRAAETITALIGTWNPVDNHEDFKASYRQSAAAFGGLPAPAGHPILLRAGAEQQTAAEYEKNYSLALAMLATSAYLCQDTGMALNFVRTAESYASVLPLNERDRIRLWDAGMRSALALGDLHALKQFAYRLFSEAAEGPSGDEVIMTRVWLADSLLASSTLPGGFERSAFIALANYRYVWLHAAQALHRHGFYRRACAQARMAAESMRDEFDEFYCNKAYSLMAASAAMVADRQLAEDCIGQILAFKPGMPDAADFLNLSKLYKIIGDEATAQRYYKKYQGYRP